MFLDLLSVQNQPLGIVAVQPVNLARLHDLSRSILPHGQHTAPFVAVLLHILDADAVIRHLLDRHDLLTEQINCRLIETVIDMGQHQLAALIDNDAGGIVPKGVVLHQPKGVTVDLLMVNRVPCADMTIHRHAGGVFVDNRAFLFKDSLFLLFFGNHRDSHNPVSDFGKLLRHFELSHKLPQKIRRKRAEAVFCQPCDKEGTGNNIIDFTAVIPQSAVERQPVHLAFFVADNGDRLFKGIDRLNVPANLML